MSDLTIRRGDTRVLRIADAVDADGDPYDWGADEIRFTVKESLADADADAVIAKTRSGGGIVPTAPGIAEITILPADTDDLPFVAVVLEFDLQVTTGAGAKYTLDSGRITVDPEVTRA